MFSDLREKEVQVHATGDTRHHAGLQSNKVFHYMPCHH